jgi:hypothetical protein
LEQLLKREGRGGQTDLAARKEFVPLKNKYLGNLAKIISFRRKFLVDTFPTKAIRRTCRGDEGLRQAL